MYLIVPADAPAPRVDDKGATVRDGRWRLNAGSLMITPVPGLNDDKQGMAQPVAVIIDLESLTFARERIPALSEHASSCVIGYWDGNKVANEGEALIGIDADLHFVTPRDDHERILFSEAVRLKALMEQGVPLQVSVGVEPGPKGEWVKVKGERAVVNGREYLNDTGFPMFILHGGQAFESSICTFGADSETGRVAATSKPHPVTKETTMSDKLKVLLSKYAENHHGLVARCVAEGDDDSVIADKIHTAEVKARDEEIVSLKARLKAMEDDESKAKAKAKAEDDEDEEKDEEKDEKETKAKAKASAGSQTGVRFGSTDDTSKGSPSVGKMSEALSVTLAKHPDLKGVQLRRKAREMFPHAVDG